LNGGFGYFQGSEVSDFCLLSDEETAAFRILAVSPRASKERVLNWNGQGPRKSSTRDSVTDIVAIDVNNL
jgi:hypothetical protein